MKRPILVACAFVLAPLGCKEATPDAAPPAPPPVATTPFPSVPPGPARVRRLTADQYRHALRDLLGPSIVLPTTLEPDPEAAGLISVGAARSSISGWGVEQYETAAYSIAQQAMADPAVRARLVPCTPAGPADDACARRFVGDFGRRLWRRPLSEDELVPLVAIAADAGRTLGDFHTGLEFAFAALLQSPSFLFRPELGEGEALTPWELASRLSFFLWNTTPDDTLLAAAESGRLSDPAGLRAEAERLLADPRAREGVRNFFAEMLELHELDQMVKDPQLFPHYSAELGPAAREETLRVIERIVFDEDADYRELFTTDRSFVDRRLAAVYGVRATAREGFGEVKLPPETRRRGLLGQVSFLALQSHPSSSSAVLRGIFVRQRLLCHAIPAPPAGVNTALPEPSATARTLRERTAVHLTEPFCAGCHQSMDPIGLSFEVFDSVGRFRSTDNGATIDATGSLDERPFADPYELAQVLHDHPDLGRCLARTAYRYATGEVETREERALVDTLGVRFAEAGHRVKALLLDIVLSPGFARVKETM